MTRRPFRWAPPYLVWPAGLDERVFQASKAIGKPVKVVWTREEDVKYDMFRAATSQRIEAGLDGQGQLIGWSHKAVCGSIMKDIDPKAIKDGVDIMSL